MLTYEGLDTIKEKCSELLLDESKSDGGIPSRVFFPENEEDLRSVMYESAKKNHPLRFVGNHTGTTGGSIPEDNEWAISFSRMNRILAVSKGSDGTVYLKCEPGITLSSIAAFLKNPQDWPYEITGKELLSPNSHFYTPDPTEMNAQLGGSVATNASGARSFKFGATRNSIQSLSIITANAETLTVNRGIHVDPRNGLIFMTDQQTQIKIPFLTFRSPEIKNVAGYYSKRPMDPVDLFIGSEGTLCAFSSITIKLRRSMNIIAGCSFFRSIDEAFTFADFLRNEKQLISIEFFDESALRFIDKNRKQISDILPLFPERATQAILWEFSENGERSFDSIFDLWENELTKCGSSFSVTWSGMELHEIERLKRFRYALPEAINATVAFYKRNCPSIRKIGTDTALPANVFATVYKEYLSLIKKNNLMHASFGHLGDYHVHINLLPSNVNELKTALNVYDQMMDITISNGGTISAEHGIGKLKIKYLLQTYGKDVIKQMKMIKTALDQHWLLNRGAIFEV